MVGEGVVSAPRVGRMRVPAIIRVSCALVLGPDEQGPCWAGSTVIAPNETLSLPLATGSGPAFFLIETVRPVDSPVVFDETIRP